MNLWKSIKTWNFKILSQETMHMHNDHGQEEDNTLTMALGVVGSVVAVYLAAFLVLMFMGVNKPWALGLLGGSSITFAEEFVKTLKDDKGKLKEKQEKSVEIKNAKDGIYYVVSEESVEDIQKYNAALDVKAYTKDMKCKLEKATLFIIPKDKDDKSAKNNTKEGDQAKTAAQSNSEQLIENLKKNLGEYKEILQLVTIEKTAAEVKPIKTN